MQPLGLYYLCRVFSCFCVCSLLPCGHLLTSWLLFLMLNCVFITFPCGILGQVFYLIVLIPDLCPLTLSNAIFIDWGYAKAMCFKKCLTVLRFELYGAFHSHYVYDFYVPKTTGHYLGNLLFVHGGKIIRQKR